MAANNRRTAPPVCPYPVEYNVEKGDCMVISLGGYTSLYRIAKTGTEPCLSLDNDKVLETRHVAYTKSNLVVCLHTGNVLTWVTNGYQHMPRSYFLGVPYKKGEKSLTEFAPGES